MPKSKKNHNNSPEIGMILEHMDGKIELIAEQFGDIKKDINVLKNNVGVLKEDIEIIKVDVGVLKEDVETIKIDIEFIKHELKNESSSQ